MSHREETTQGPSIRAWSLFLVFAVVLLAVYAPALRGTPVWDDDVHMTSAARRGLSGLARIWFEPGATPQYYPLTHSVFWLQDQLWSGSVLGHHVVNVLLHAANATLVLVLLRRLAVPGAWIGAALFALHPVQVESVAWISELKNTLSGLFYLGALLRLVPWLLARPEQRARGAWWSALALFLVALLSKAVTATLPAAALLIVAWKLGSLSWRRHVLPLLPFFALALAFGSLSIYMERHVVGAKDAGDVLAFSERWLVAGRAAWFYAAKLAWPLGLTFIYPRWVLSSAALAQWLFPLAAVAVLAALLALRRRLGRGALVSALFFIGTLVPALGFVNVFPFRYAFVADHFQYLACAGLLAGLGALLARVLERSTLGDGARRAAACVPLLPLAVLTALHSADFRSSETLWRATLERNPGCWMAASNLGSELRRSGRVEEGIALQRRAIIIDPQLVEPRFNLGNALAELGRDEEAVSEYRAALELQPDSIEVLANLGSSLIKLGRRDEGQACLRRALEIEPRFALVHNNLANTLAQEKATDEALEHYHQAIALDPSYAGAHTGLAKLLADLGRMDESQASFQRVLQLTPNDPEAHYNYGLLLGRRRDFAGAARQFEFALRLKPDYAAAARALQQAREAQQPRPGG